MREEENVVDFIDEIASKRAAAEALLDVGQAMIDRAEAARQRIESQRAVDRDLKDGSVEALLRVKEQFNQSIDEMIEKNLGLS